MIFLSDYLQKTYGCKLYRLSFDLGCTCPNRDGTISFGGCTFCSAGGSGDFAEKVLAVADIDPAIRRAKERVRAKSDSGRYIAYFQAFTNTYGDLAHLGELYREFQKRDEIEILSVATRPDCLGPEVLALLSGLRQKKPVWVELGLQTVHERTAERIHRGYALPVFETAYRELKARGIPVIVHVILGLPGESPEDMRQTIRFLAGLDPKLDGIKLALLHVLKNTRLAEEFQQNKAELYPFTLEEYARLVSELLCLLPPDTVVHRMTGDGGKKDLIYPLWSGDKKRVLNAIRRNLRIG